TAVPRRRRGLGSKPNQSDRNRPQAHAQGGLYERAVSARKRSLAEQVGRAKSVHLIRWIFANGLPQTGRVIHLRQRTRARSPLVVDSSLLKGVHSQPGRRHPVARFEVSYSI